MQALFELGQGKAQALASAIVGLRVTLVAQVWGIHPVLADLPSAPLGARSS
jgi:hypothetical protein